MIKKNLLLIFLFCIMHVQVYAAANSVNTSENSTTKMPTDEEFARIVNIAEAAVLLFPESMPTKSINEKNIETIFGSPELKIDRDDIASIKKSYCYLEFLVKIDKVKNDKSLAQHAADFKDFLQPSTDNSVLKPTQALVNSKGWQAIQIKAEDIINSPAWQMFIKSIITDIVYNDEEFIVDSASATNQISPFIPNIEQAYTDNEFTKLRFYEESIQLQALMQHEQKTRYLAQCSDWKNLDPDKLINAIAEFKQTDFYKFSHNGDAIKPIKDPKTGSIIPIIIPSPLREHIVCYSMLIQIQLMIHDIITEENAQSVLAQVSSQKLAPNFLFYNPTDFIYMNDLFTLQNLNDQNTNNPKKPLIAMKADTESDSRDAIETQIDLTPPTPSNPLSITPQMSPSQAAASVFDQLPTTSIYEETLDKIYGKSGLNIAKDQLDNLKRTYCYLEFLVKVTKVRTDKNFAQYQLTDFKEYAYAGMTTLNMPTQTLVTSDAWKKIPVTQNDIVASPAWQNFLKALVCDCIDNEKDFITKSTDANNQMFPYIPNIETAYATQDCTDLRLYLESMQLYALMQSEQKSLLIKQCTDWKAIDPTKIDDVVAAFKKTDFYSNTHNPQSAPTAKTPIPFVTAEQIVSYFLLITMQNDLFEMLELNNLSSFLKQGNSIAFAPNLLTYNSSDFIYLYDFLTLKDLLNNSKKNPVSTLVMAPTDSNNVVVQNMRNTVEDDEDTDDVSKNDVIIQKIKLKKIGKAISKGSSNALDPSKNDFNEVVSKPADKALDPNKNNLNKSVEKTNKASAKALDPNKNNFNKVVSKPADKALDPSKNGFDKIVSAPAKKALNKMNEEIAKVFVVVDTALFDLSMGMATAFIEASSMTVFAGCSFAALFPGSHVNPAAQRDRCRADMNKYKVIIAGVLFINFIIIPIILSGGTLAPFVVQGSFAGAMIKGKRTNSMLMTTMMPVLMPIMEGMEIMTNAWTTGFIEFSVFMTWCAYSYAKLFNPKINVKQEMNRVRAKMEEHRASINIAMGIFISLVMTIAIMVLTMGAGAAMSAVTMSGWLGAEAAAAETAKQAAIIAAKEAAIILAKQAAIQAAKQAAIQGAKQSMYMAAKAAAKAAAQAAIQAAKSAAQASAKFLVSSGDDALISVMDDATIAAGRAGAQAAGNTAIKTAGSMSDDLLVNFGDDAARIAGSNLDEGAMVGAKTGTQTVGSSTARGTGSSLLDDAAMATDDTVAATARGGAGTGGKTAAVSSIDDVAMSADDAAAILAKENARLAGRSLSQRAIEDGFWRALWNATIADVGFMLGQALNLGFGVFSILASKEADNAAVDRLEKEKESIESLWRFVEDIKVSSTQTEKLFLDELHKKHQVAVENQAFELQYYNNFLNGSINNAQTQIAQALARQHIQMLTPDSNGLRIADIGSSWGLQTPFTYLYPAQGFLSTTLGRPNFPYAQEIAQAPLVSEDLSSKPVDLSDKQPAATKLWFNQRAISVVNQPATQPLNVEIRFRILYNLTTAYHVGLYLGGNYHDYESPEYLQKLQDTGSIDINTAHLAKMFVLKRDNEKSAPSLGLYENEGKGWIAEKPIDANTLNTAAVYRMSANLNKDQLTVAFWPEDKPADKWTQTTTVTPCDQRTFGVIFSGIAIEWGVIKPNQPIVENKKARSALKNRQSEADRERASKAQWKQLLNPKFGSMTMQSPGRAAILQGQYLYTTQSTGLTDAQGKSITDYMVFATASGSNVTNIGASPAPSEKSQTPNAVISLITGNVYNSSNKIITNKQNTLDVYAQKNTSIPLNVAQSIIKSGQDYKQQLSTFTFGSYQLTAASDEALNAGLFIYTCPSTITTKDYLGNPILDYLIMADLINNSLGSSVGMPPSNTVPGMISLVTGNVYGKSQKEPVDGGYSELTQYTKKYGTLPATLAKSITTASNLYKNSLSTQTQTTQATKQAQVNVIASQTVSFTDLLNTLPPSTGGLQIGLSNAAPTNIVTTTSSISQLQVNAAGGASLQVSGFGPIGLSFGSSTANNANSTAMTYAMPTQDSGKTIAIISTSQSTPIVIDEPVDIKTPEQKPNVQVTEKPVATTQASQAPAATPALSNYDFSTIGPVGLSFGAPKANAYNPAPVINIVTTNQEATSYNQPVYANTTSPTINTTTGVPPFAQPKVMPSSQPVATSTQTTVAIPTQTYALPTEQATVIPAQTITTTPAQSYQVASQPQPMPTFSNSDFALVGSSGFAF